MTYHRGANHHPGHHTPQASAQEEEIVALRCDLDARTALAEARAADVEARDSVIADLHGQVATSKAC
jgi:hypothetical protein